MKTHRIVISSALLLACAALSGRRASAQEMSGDGFLFGAPKVSVSLRMGYAAPSAGSDLFSFVTRELSLRKGDFAGFTYGMDIAMPLTTDCDWPASASFPSCASASRMPFAATALSIRRERTL